MLGPNNEVFRYSTPFHERLEITKFENFVICLEIHGECIEKISVFEKILRIKEGITMVHCQWKLQIRDSYRLNRPKIIP